MKLLVPALLFSLSLSAQTDFNEYKPIVSKGEVPEDFTLSTNEKFREDLKNDNSTLSVYQQVEFYRGVNYSIDEILHSGRVVYGDEISNYANDIMDVLLKRDKELRSQIRIYTIKSNIANAFSTDQGIIFITTGLVAQLTSEAQLAFILAHELSHYTEKHVINTFDWKTRNPILAHQIESLGTYSKEKEFSADKLAIELYRKAGYSPDEVESTFDVLMYSYLPFDEIPVPQDYFQTDLMFVPDALFPTEKFEVKAIEDYDDSKSSHPNIRKRKEAVQIELEEAGRFKDELFKLGEGRFYNVREISRFEIVRTDIMDANLANALYSIYLLELKHPNSIYLKRMKAHTWLHIYMYAKEGELRSTFDRKKELEGESAFMHYFLDELNRESARAISIRTIYDLMNETKDSEIKVIYNKLIEVLGSDGKFDLDEFSDKTFQEYAQELLDAMNDTTSVKTEVVEEQPLSKYDRIKKKKTVTISNTIDSTHFYLYALTDILQDENFLSALDKSKENYRKFEKEQAEIKELTDKSYKEYLKNKKFPEILNQGENILVLEPRVVYVKRGEFDPLNSEKVEDKFAEAIIIGAEECDINAVMIRRAHLEVKGTDYFNERSTLIEFVNQISNEDDVNELPVNFSDLQEIKDRYDSRYVMFNLVNHYKDADISWYGVALGTICYPFAPFVYGTYIPYKLFTRSKSTLNVIIVDTETGAVVFNDRYHFNEPLNQHGLGAHVYEVLYNLSYSK